ncbi:heme exporter protein CcmD [Nocardioides insulae]|uniref:heme exporter protein CcmD n=1 Tax=Nocardioides insulae TaxID=394734 RepID=UPI0003F8264E|nr:heme exporter protein CcmD [Nocardioides insulae]
MNDLFPLFLSFATDPVPADEDVKAGWTAFAIFLLLCVAVGLLGWSLVRQLRKAERNKKAGAFGDAPENDEGSGSGSDRDHPQQRHDQS